MTAKLSPKGQWLTFKGKLSMVEVQTYVRKLMPRLKDTSWKFVGSNPCTIKGFFSHEISVKVYLHHLAVEFVKHIRVSCMC